MVGLGKYPRKSTVNQILVKLVKDIVEGSLR